MDGRLLWSCCLYGSWCLRKAIKFNNSLTQHDSVGIASAHHSDSGPESSHHGMCLRGDVYCVLCLPWAVGCMLAGKQCCECRKWSWNQGKLATKRMHSLMFYEPVIHILKNIPSSCLKYDGSIKSQFCTCHASWAGMACAKLWLDWVATRTITAKRIFMKFNLWASKPFAKWVCGHTFTNVVKMSSDLITIQSNTRAW